MTILDSDEYGFKLKAFAAETLSTCLPNPSKDINNALGNILRQIEQSEGQEDMS